MSWQIHIITIHTMTTRFIVILAAAALPFTSAFAQMMVHAANQRLRLCRNQGGAGQKFFSASELKPATKISPKRNVRMTNGFPEALGFLKNSGMKDKDVQTDLVNIEPAYNNETSGPNRPFTSSAKSIEIKVITVTNFEGLLTGLLTNGVNHVYGIDFRTSQLRKYRDEARAMAIQAAREKADSMALGFGVKRGKICNINVNDWGGMYEMTAGNGFHGGYQNSYQNNGALADVSGETFSPGQISVSASVTAAYLIQ